MFPSSALSTKLLAVFGLNSDSWCQSHTKMFCSHCVVCNVESSHQCDTGGCWELITQWGITVLLWWGIWSPEDPAAFVYRAPLSSWQTLSHAYMYILRWAVSSFWHWVWNRFWVFPIKALCLNGTHTSLYMRSDATNKRGPVKQMHMCFMVTRRSLFTCCV